MSAHLEYKNKKKKQIIYKTCTKSLKLRLGIVWRNMRRNLQHTNVSRHHGWEPLSHVLFISVASPRRNFLRQLCIWISSETGKITSGWRRRRFKVREPPLRFHPFYCDIKYVVIFLIKCYQYLKYATNWKVCHLWLTYDIYAQHTARGWNITRRSPIFCLFSLLLL